MDTQHLTIGDLESSGFDPEIFVSATAIIEMNDVGEGGDGSKSVPLAQQVM